MRAGQLRSRMLAQNPQVTGTGPDYQLLWPPDGGEEFHVWGKIEPLSANEAFFASQVRSTTSHTITLRATKNIREKVSARTRFVFRGRYFYASGNPINSEERNREIRLMAIEETPSHVG